MHDFIDCICKMKMYGILAGDQIKINVELETVNPLPSKKNPKTIYSGGKNYLTPC